jgi:hypothetical protein
MEFGNSIVHCNVGKYFVVKIVYVIPLVFCFSGFCILLQICPIRTWQSLKEHFIKQIMPNIEKYDLSEEELSKFQNV